jgi:hypothetical protein
MPPAAPRELWAAAQQPTPAGCRFVAVGELAGVAGELARPRRHATLAWLASSLASLATTAGLAWSVAAGELTGADNLLCTAQVCAQRRLRGRATQPQPALGSQPCPVVGRSLAGRLAGANPPLYSAGRHSAAVPAFGGGRQLATRLLRVQTPPSGCALQAAGRQPASDGSWAVAGGS